MKIKFHEAAWDKYLDGQRADKERMDEITNYFTERHSSIFIEGLNKN